jgi:hypothetical protein
MTQWPSAIFVVRLTNSLWRCDIGWRRPRQNFQAVLRKKIADYTLVL